MKKSSRLNLFLLPTMAFILTQSAINSAFAKIPGEDSLDFSSSLSISDQKLDRALNYKNMKGELIRIREVNPSTGVQGNLWSTLDPVLDSIEGTSTEKTYLDPRLPKAGKEIIVAVIDSGIDVNHEDLIGKIWNNTNEIPGNGIDDDKNGFIDDMNGWNFIGNKNGENIEANTLEITREVARLTKKAAVVKLRSSEAAYFKKLKIQYMEEVTDVSETLKFYQDIATAIELLKQNGLKEETIAGLNAVTATGEAIDQAKALAMRVFARNRTSADVAAWIADSKEKLDFGYNLEFDCSKVIGDDPRKLNEVGYGNNNVTGSFEGAVHGTHVAGIIAANRDNNLGILGQADSVKIMALRAVPNGDERDKDVANAIIYAVKNGAKVINMSFGKEFSPNKTYVDKAVAFAEKNGVLLIHAAGNSGKNTESANNNFPNKRLFNNTQSAREASTWIEVGASYKNKNETLPANFTNWGKTSVDLFAPGMAIASTVPGGFYKELQGTSMASPEVAGVAALLMAHFPQKSSPEIVKSMMSTTTQYKGLIVNLPGTSGVEKVSFSHLSKTGGVVNTFSAMEALLQ